MATSSVFTVLERNYLKLALSMLAKSLIRSIASEANPEIQRLKSDDVRAVEALSTKIGGMQ